MEKRKIQVYSEIGDLRTVLLHRPGAEIENLTPDYLERLLFDDIPFLKVAREEHDAFAKILRDNNVEVLYLENLVARAVRTPDVKEKFVSEVIAECNITDPELTNTIKDYLKSMPEKEMVDTIIAGIRKKDIGMKEEYGDYPFVMDPMPNLYFQRDPMATMGRGVTLNHMRTVTRRRETIFAKYVFKHHPEFKDSDIPFWYNRDEQFSVEGGDELIISPEVIFIGCSQRTDAEAIKKIAKNLFTSGESFKKVMMFEIPKSRAFMHLDTVFTMIDYDKFTVHPGIEGTLRVESFTYDEAKKDLKVVNEEGSLEQILSKTLGRDITCIRCGGGDNIIAGREQWNDGSNTLAIRPGTVVTYERNYVTNEILSKYNINVLTMPSAELSRGRGGPRCMSMPLVREPLNEI
jgi:arginine deiminase